MRRAALLVTSLTIVATACGSGGETPEAAPETSAAPVPSSPAADGQGAGATAPGTDRDDASPSPSEDGTEPTQASSSPAPAEPTAPAATPASSAPPPESGAPVAAPPGTYRYATDGQSQTGDQEPRPMPDVTTLVVFEPYNGAKQDRLRDLRDEDGVGSATTTMFQHAGDGTYLTGLRIETTVELFGSTYTDTRDLVAMPPALIAPPDVQPGDVATFHLEGDEMVADGTMEMIRQETLQVDGVDVVTNVIDVDVTFSGSVEGSSDSTWWVRPEDLLLVREIAESEGRQGTVTFSSSHESMLLSLEPR